MISKMLSLEEITSNNLCSGCGLCESLFNKKVNMKLSDRGFLQPVLKDEEELSQEETKLLNSVCPGLGLSHYALNKDKNVENTLWGNSKSMGLGHSLNDEIRYRGSSGGVISAILVYLIENKYIDAVLHIGVCDINPLLNEVKISTSREEILVNSGSRYAPSAPLTTVNELLNTQKKYAVVGKPCDIVAMRKYAMVNPTIEETFKYMISFFCAGVPSHSATIDILNSHNVEEKDVVSFRYRGNGWPGKTVVKTNTNEFSSDYEESWGKILNKKLNNRCKMCIDGIGEFADISCGDGWVGDEKGYPTFKEGAGTSLVIGRTEKGEDLLKEMMENNSLSLEPLKDLTYIDKIQPFQKSRRSQLPVRLLTMKLLNRKIPKYDRNLLRKLLLKNSLKNNAKGFVGTFIRIIEGKL
ncbi:Coenzyme F420 hydrogenase/dehydrogenase, beta subunit C-terminal domain [Bacillus sp. FJAT-29814]|uniref:Coenzyme F420 hydrogenase/dehydrogenase, beta subunit C-terminal domain n=1 Tax=Bacillus sp. FJAT-29814 TaxID=1729688 RepID=UPI00082C33F8|nr:Coenzyme F420 hydrogenase/dehydrogenase, beta subunit C-terminal domain [Bacillus sp. FJAT-29814]